MKLRSLARLIGHTVVDPGDTVHVLAWNGCRLATVKAMSPDAICGWRVFVAFDDGTDAWLPLAPRGTDLLGWHLPMLDCVMAAQPSSSGITPHETPAQHPSTTPPDPKQTHHTPKQGRPKMRDSQNKDSTDATPDTGGQKEGTCSTTPSDPEQVRPLTQTFHPPPSTTSANPTTPDAPSNPVPPTGTPEQGTPVQVGTGEIWCALCGADGRADGRDTDRCPDPRRDPAPLVSGCRWVRSALEAIQVATAATPNPREPFAFYPAPGEMATSCVVDGGSPTPAPSETRTVCKHCGGDVAIAEPFMLRDNLAGTERPCHPDPRSKAPEPVAPPSAPVSWCAFCGETSPTVATHCGVAEWRQRHHMVSSADEARAASLAVESPSCWKQPKRELPVPENWRAAGLCIWCGSHVDPISGLCQNRHRNEDATPYDAEVRRAVGIGDSRAEKLKRVRKLAHETLAEALSEGRRRTRDPRHAPPVGFVESVLQTAKAVDAEHWQDAEDSITETVVHLRAVAVLLEDVSPPGEMLRLRALFARSSFAADFLADELSHVRELLRREVKKGAAS